MNWEQLVTSGITTGIMSFVVLPLLFYIGKSWFENIITSSVKLSTDKLLEEYKLELQNNKENDAKEAAADLILFNSLQSLFTEKETIKHLRIHNFSVAFYYTIFEPIDDFIENWNLPEYKFHNESINSKINDLLTSIEAFRNFLGENTFSKIDSNGEGEVPREWRSQDQEKYYQTIFTLNNLASNSVIAYDSLITVARSELKC